MGDPWISIIGLNEDSVAGLPAASREALERADVIFGGPRHLDLVGAGAKGRAWPVPFSVDPVLACRGQQAVVLASGDPFWFGAGSSLIQHLDPGEWRAFSAPSTFSLAAAVLGWRMEETTCHGLHAAPFARLCPVIAPNARAICLLRDEHAPAKLATWLVEQNCGSTEMSVLERIGGPHQRIRRARADTFDLNDIAAPVTVALLFPQGVGLPRASGLPDDVFTHDGQITKRPIRALTLSALQPQPGALLWDIGAGSGSISIEWCLAGGRAVAFERHASRAQNIASNIKNFGLGHKMEIFVGDAVEMIKERPLPEAVFIGGGANMTLLETVLGLVAPATRLVMNAVTLETETLLAQLHSQYGGDLLRIELAQSAPLGQMRGWTPARPVVQWSVTL